MYPVRKPLSMRYFFAFLFVCCLSCSSNEAEEEFIPVSASNIVGSWDLKATKISPGNEVDWSPNEQLDNYTFSLDGTFTRESEFLEDGTIAGTYTITDNQIAFTYISKTGDPANPRYFYKLSSSELILSYIGCIEECSLRYRKRQ